APVLRRPAEVGLACLRCLGAGAGQRGGRGSSRTEVRRGGGGRAAGGGLPGGGAPPARGAPPPRLRGPPPRPPRAGAPRPGGRRAPTPAGTVAGRAGNERRRCASATSSAVPPNGGAPVRHSYPTTPREYRSDAGVAGPPAARSGAR